jgi:outer membrane immunogenic protein
MKFKLRGLLALGLGFGFAQVALAADMPMKAPIAPVAPVYSWTGFYVGLEGGGGWDRAEQSDIAFRSGPYNTSGYLAGGTVGYNWQSGHAVFGLEGDLSASGISGSTPGTNPVFGPCGGAPPQCHSSIDAIGTARGRIGYAWSRVLVYATGGLAFADVHGNEGTIPLAGAVGSGSTWVAGYTVGAGVEAVVAPSWTVKLEYLYVNLGTHSVFTDTLPVPPPLFATESLRLHPSIVRAGINYHFGAPVVAKY